MFLFWLEFFQAFYCWFFTRKVKNTEVCVLMISLLPAVLTVAAWKLSAKIVQGRVNCFDPSCTREAKLTYLHDIVPLTLHARSRDTSALLAHRDYNVTSAIFPSCSLYSFRKNADDCHQAGLRFLWMGRIKRDIIGKTNFRVVKKNFVSHWCLKNKKQQLNTHTKDKKKGEEKKKEKQ